MTTRSWTLTIAAAFMGAVLVTLGACSRENNQPAENQSRGNADQVNMVEKKPEQLPATVSEQPRLSVPGTAIPKIPDKKMAELGRSSVTQAEEPAVRTPDLHGWDPLAADCAWFREFKRDISADGADPYSDQMLGRLLKAKGHIDAQWSGSWTPADWNWYTMPFQVVKGDTAPSRYLEPGPMGPHPMVRTCCPPNRWLMRIQSSPATQHRNGLRAATTICSSTFATKQPAA